MTCAKCVLPSACNGKSKARCLEAWRQKVRSRVDTGDDRVIAREREEVFLFALLLGCQIAALVLCLVILLSGVLATHPICQCTLWPRSSASPPLDNQCSKLHLESPSRFSIRVSGAREQRHATRSDAPLPSDLREQLTKTPHMTS